MSISFLNERHENNIRRLLKFLFKEAPYLRIRFLENDDNTSSLKWIEIFYDRDGLDKIDIKTLYESAS